ncbi:lysis system i-spanin subunit Rz [Pseudomonas sp.]|uniref:lysis system i-spanin subunit Rz n=1 Tax=Pseudomonas sp. TaxID=306 RepID=UPI0027353055|nr:lysis system i-spanin subunit Rz [Pseudomonas sp.]MDP2746210.1 lysis system i-spanin subunit Rz [Pseudomonas sp.]
MSLLGLIPGSPRTWLLGALLVVVFAAGWAANGWRMGEQLAEAEKTHSDTLGEISRAAARQVSDQLDARVQSEQLLADLDSTKHKELTDAEGENERWRRLYSGADDERKRLRIEARIAAADLVVSKTTGSSGLGDGASVELSERAGSAVWDIRAGMIRDQKKLEYLQGYVRTLTGQAATTP